MVDVEQEMGGGAERDVGRQREESEESASWGMWDVEEKKKFARVTQCQKGGNTGREADRGDLGGRK